MLHAFLSLGWEGRDEDGRTDGATDGRTDGAEQHGAAEEDAAVRRLLYVLQALHVRLTLHLGKVWQRMRAEPSTTIMDFPNALRQTYAHLQRALRLAGAAPWRLETVIAHLESAPPPLDLTCRHANHIKRARGGRRHRGP